MLAAALTFFNSSAGAQTVTDYASFHSALATGYVTNFAPNVAINISTVGTTFEISQNTVIDGGSNIVVLSGGNATRLFYVHTNYQLILRNVELTGGWNNTNGGAIYSEGVLIISNCTFIGNSVTNVAGPSGVAGTNTVFNGANGTNGASSSGGAIFSRGPLFVYNSYFANNTNFGASGGAGGAGLSTGVFTYAGFGGTGGAGGNAYGGAICGTGASNILFATEFLSNICAAGNGGVGGAAGTNVGSIYYNGGSGESGVPGVAEGGAVYIAGALELSNSLFAGNIAAGGYSAPAAIEYNGVGENGVNGGAAAGGGVYLAATAKELSFFANAIFFTNACYGGQSGGASGDSTTGGNGGAATGGGVDVASGTVYLQNCTLADNLLVGGPAGADIATNNATNGVTGVMQGWDIYRGTGTVRIANSILTGTVGAAYDVTDAGYNITSDSSLAPVLSTTKSQTNPLLDSGLSEQSDVQIGPMGTNGTPLLTLAVLSGSPATNVIPGVPGLSFPATDEEFRPRGTPTTIGAFEYNPITPALAGAPQITTEPINETNSLGGTGNFSVIAKPVQGDPNMVGYQWQLNGTNLPATGGGFSGVNTANLTVKNISGPELGAYQVVVSPTLLEGAATSTVAYLLVDIPATIKSQPASRLNVPNGAAVVFKVGVAGAPPFFFQWYQNGVALSDSNEISGSATSNLLINPATFSDAASYQVVISNYFHAATSAVARLVVVADKTKPTISITSPAANARVTNVIVTGKAADNAQVAAVVCNITNIFAGVTNGFETNAFLDVTDTNNTLWAISNVFAPGSNIISAHSVDFSSNVSAVVTRRFFNVAPSIFTLSYSGSGTVTGTAAIPGTARPTNGVALNVGEGYTLTAHPGPGEVLSNWTSDTGLNVYANTLEFTMTNDLSITANFVGSPFGPLAGTYNGLFYDSDHVTPETAGMISGFTVGALGAYSGKLMVGGTTYPVTGTLNVLGMASNHLARAAARGGPIGVSWNLAALNNPFATNELAGTVSGMTGTNAWVSLIFAQRKTDSNTFEATLELVTTTNSVGTVPPGCGYLLLTNHLGMATLTGALPDGTALSESIPASESGSMPIYKSLYNGGGLLIGWIDATNADPFSYDGLNWIKPASKTAAGFTNILSVTGSAWSNGAAYSLSGGLVVSNAAFQFSNSISLSGGVITSGDSQNALKGTVNEKTGLVKLTFNDGSSRALLAGYGVVLQDQTNLDGYFVAQSGDGAIFLNSPPAPPALGGLFDPTTGGIQQSGADASNGPPAPVLDQSVITSLQSTASGFTAPSQALNNIQVFNPAPPAVP